MNSSDSLALIAEELALLHASLKEKNMAALPTEFLETILSNTRPLKAQLLAAWLDAEDIINWCEWYSRPEARLPRQAPKVQVQATPNLIKELLDAVAAGKITPEMIAEAKAKAQEQK